MTGRDDHETHSAESFWANAADYLRRSVHFTIFGEDLAAMVEGSPPTVAERRRLLDGLERLFAGPEG